MIISPERPCIDHQLARRAERAPDSVAIAAPGRPRLTHEALHRQVQTVVATLNDMGVCRRDRVAILLPTGPELAVACLGVAACATSAPLNPTYRRNELEFYLSHLRVAALVIASELDSPAREMAHQRHLPVIELSRVEDAAAGVFSLRGASRAGPVSDSAAQPDDAALVLHTSGTTSWPKIVPLTHANLCVSAENMAHALALGETDRCLNVTHLFHIHGLMVTLASLLSGGSVACLPPTDVSKFFVYLEELRPTWYSAVPAVHQSILASAASNRDSIARRPLRFIRSSSAALPTRVRGELEEVFDAPVLESYGMTEAALQITCNPLPPRARKIGSVGVAAGPEVAIVDDAGAQLPPRQVGEIVIRGPSVMKGYENDPAANANTWINGWLKTGDQGYLDEDSYLYITGRIKELINRGGLKISPREVDEVLLDHPAIARAVTFPVPHAALGEDIAGAVVLREGTVASKEAIREFVAARLAEFKVPRRLVIVPSIPTGPTGKYQRRALAEQLGLLGPAGALGSPSAKRLFVKATEPLQVQLTHIWETLLGIRPIGVTDDFFDLGGYSLLAARMLDEVEQVCGWTVPPSALFSASTIERLARVLLASRGAPPTGPSVMPFRPGGSRVPFVLLHGDFSGVGFYCRNLVSRLDPEQPFYALPPHGSSGDPVPPTIEAMAGDYLAKLRAVVPDGPYQLGGFSHGGLIAFEMAWQLRAQGKHVALLVVIDREVANPRWRLLRALVDGLGRPRGFGIAERRDAFLLWKYRVGRLFDLAKANPREQISYLLSKAGARLRPTAAASGAPETPRLGLRPRSLLLLDAYNPIIEAYVPRRYPGRVMLIASADRAAGFPSDPTMGWGQVARDVRVLSVPGTHLSSITAYVDVLAKRLRACLDEAEL